MKKRIILIILILLLGLICFYFGQNFDKVKEGYYIEQGYSFKNPQGWEKTYELGPLAFLNKNENNYNNPFKSYIFFIKDELKGRSSEQYFDYIKTQVKNSSESIEILDEKEEGAFHVIFIKAMQNENNYVIGTALTKGIHDTYFVISFKTLESSLENTKPVFEEVYKTFKLR
ncbi:MAG: hypothetical protein PHU74_02555 [Candidatus Pacebacteria bacterium]|nr:hypothetical protein [Candidatus Paceibacterota bacterium]